MTPNGTDNERRPISVPDPTVLTTEALDRAFSGLNATLQTAIVTLGDRLQQAIVSDANLMDEKFSGLDKQLAMIESHRQEQKADGAKAIGDALQAVEKSYKEQTTASEKATEKTDKSTAEAIKQLSATFVETIKGLSGSIEDVKTRVGSLDNRLTSSEAGRHGNPDRERIVAVEATRTGAKDNTAQWMSAAALALVVLGLVAKVFI